MATGVRRITDKYKWVSKGYGQCAVMGSSANPIYLGISDQAPFEIQATSTLITGNIKAALINCTYTGADATAHNIEVLKVQLTSAKKTGQWVNTIFGRMNYSSGGYAYGSASAICGELSMPPDGPGAGNYSVFQAEIDCPTGCNGVVPSLAVFNINVWGDAKTEFDDNGVLFDISGVASGDGKFYEDATVGNIDAWVKCRIDDKIYYIRLSNDSAA